MDRLAVHSAMCFASIFAGWSAQAEVIVACTFPSMPPVVMRFPDSAEDAKTMEVGGRPSVELVEGQGDGRLISATVDGYSFRFSPDNSMLDVDLDGARIATEAGRCVTLGAPATETPLQIATTDATAELSEPATPVSSTQRSTDKGRWVVTEDKSAFDDTRTVVISLASNETVRGQFGSPGPAMLHVRCKENTTVFYLWINDLFLSDIQGYGVIDYRIDDRAASRLRAEGSTDNKALGLWNGGTSIPFLKDLVSGKKVAFRATPYNESPVEFTFDLTGMEAAITPLREACSW